MDRECFLDWAPLIRGAKLPDGCFPSCSVGFTTTPQMKYDIQKIAHEVGVNQSTAVRAMLADAIRRHKEESCRDPQQA